MENNIASLVWPRSLCFLGLSLLAGVALAQDADDVVATVDQKTGTKVNVGQRIADVTAFKILKERQDEKLAAFGSADIFLTPNSSTVIDTQTLGMPENAMSFTMTMRDIVVNGEPERGGGTRIFSGAKTGSTKVMMFEAAPGGGNGRLLKVYNVTVSKEDLIALLEEIKALIGGTEGLELKIVGEQIVLDGQILLPTDMRRILEVVEKYKNKPLLNLVEISPLSMRMIAEKMEEEIAGGKDRPRDIRVRVLNGRFFLEGIVDKVSERQTAIRICKAYVQPLYVMNSRLPLPDFSQGSDTDDPVRECNSLVRIRAGQPQQPDPIIAVRVDFVTLTKNYAKAFNFNWTPGMKTEGSTNYNTDTGKFLTSFVATLSSLFPTLDTLSSHGHARILKSATLLVRDGSAAGGDAPPPSEISETLSLFIPRPGGGDVAGGFEKIDVNTQIALLVKSLAGSDKLNMDINVQQMEVQDAKEAQVATQQNRIKTSIVLGNGESAALGGLISERRNVSIVRDPAKSGETDFNLFEFSRNHTFQDGKSQFIVFVTPTKMRTPAEGTEALKRKFRLRK